MTQAARSARIAPSTAYRRRERVKSFAEKWAEAEREALSNLEIKAVNMAMEGDSGMIRYLLGRKLPHVYGGQAAELKDAYRTIARLEAEIGRLRLGE